MMALFFCMCCLLPVFTACLVYLVDIVVQFVCFAHPQCYQVADSVPGRFSLVHCELCTMMLPGFYGLGLFNVLSVHPLKTSCI